jgi:hypothetical protein
VLDAGSGHERLDSGEVAGAQRVFPERCVGQDEVAEQIGDDAK